MIWPRCIIMTKQIEQLKIPFHLLSLDAQEQVVDTVRYNKYVLRPSFQAKKKKAVRAKQKTVSTKVKNLVKGMSPEDIAKMLEALEKKE